MSKLFMSKLVLDCIAPSRGQRDVIEIHTGSDAVSFVTIVNQIRSVVVLNQPRTLELFEFLQGHLNAPVKLPITTPRQRVEKLISELDSRNGLDLGRFSNYAARLREELKQRLDEGEYDKRSFTFDIGDDFTTVLEVTTSPDGTLTTREEITFPTAVLRAMVSPSAVLQKVGIVDA